MKKTTYIETMFLVTYLLIHSKIMYVAFFVNLYWHILELLNKDQLGVQI